MAAKRSNLKRSAVDSGVAISTAYNQYAGSIKHVAAGPALEVLGALSAEISVGFGASLWIYNNSGTVGFVAFYKPGVSVPTPSSMANAIAIPPNSYLQVNSGLNSIIVGSASTLGVYKIVDDTALNPDDNQGN
jgi:hypothetical protein